MEQPSSSSKVTVEYFDPYEVYQLLSPGLLPRLPLRNLHWESHAGPLRSISTLHVDLVSSSHNVDATSVGTPSASSTNLSRVKSEDSGASGDDGFKTQSLGQHAAERPSSMSGPAKAPARERRHQIPGLRQTPYLKVFFLRCDDNDTYKSEARQKVRDWIKEHTPPAQSSKKSNAQENHDAFEWMIVHIVVPNTAAATQPRTSGKGPEGSSGASSEKSGPRWRGGGSSTLLEKLRADFNGTSKSAVDRVAQIRIGINDVPYEMLPRVVPAIPGSYSETAQENENSWMDLITKLKYQILSSFDMRVSQYEEDIREKDAQRTLPGWNFCTFFVLKEGLARGFESVGLVEDSLVGYDELAVGLDAVVREKVTLGGGAEHGGSLLPYTEELKQQVERAKVTMKRDLGATDVIEGDEPIDLQSNTDVTDETSEIALNATRKRYRELILANNISVFDFRCYIFARQLTLLLRLANASSSQEELLAKLKEQRESSLQGVAARLPKTQPAEDAENLSVLAEVCRRSMDFVSSIARVMRDDIWASQQLLKENSKIEGRTNDSKSLSQDPVMTQVVDNVVSSFTFAIAQQILAQTATKSLPIPPSTLAPPSNRMSADGQEPKAAIPEPKTMMHPARSSSLAIRSRSREPPSPGLFPGGRRSSVPEQGAVSSSFLKVGLEELAAYRAELYLLSRNVLQRVGSERDWSVGWEEASEHMSSSDLQEIDLNDSAATEEQPGVKDTKIPPSDHGIENKLLRTALGDQESFYRLYETLTDKALRHYTVANRTSSMQASMADLAVLKYHLTDFAAAASYFYRMTPFYGEGGWAQIELSMLVMYAKCLEKLRRKEEYVKVVLKLLSKVAVAENERLQRKSSLLVGRQKPFEHSTQQIDSYLPGLLEITKTMPNPVQIPIQSFFGKIEIDGTVRYHPEKDSIGLQLRLLYLLDDDLTVEKARLRVVSTFGDALREIWLEAEGPIVVKKGSAKLVMQTNTIIPGTYTVNHISLYTSNVTLYYDHATSTAPPGKVDTFFKCPKLLFYQRSESFDVRLYSSRYMHLDRNRSLEFELAPGWNSVTNGELHVRAATAGLRLQTSETKVAKGSLELSRKSEAGVVRFGAMESHSIIKLAMPFNLEHEVNEITLKLELSYTTDTGTFLYASSPSISIMLPLGVNVQDVFKHKALFSKFTISSATTSPIRLLSSKLEDSEIFKASGHCNVDKPFVVFPRQPATILYKITRTGIAPQVSSATSKKTKSPLSLVLEYTVLEEEIEGAVTSSLKSALAKTPLQSYERLVVPVFVRELREYLSPYELERIAILNEISTSIVSTANWSLHFSGLGRMLNTDQEAALAIDEFLQTWLKQTPTILLDGHNDVLTSRRRSIMIPVEVPSVTVVHTADLKLLERSKTSSTVVAAANQPISASLSVKWTRIWDTEVRPENMKQEESLEFYYEVVGHADSWLIGGKRKGHFKISSGPTDSPQLDFPIVLIPLREGFLPFPNVEIKTAPIAKIITPGSTGDEHEPKENLVVSCETDYKNAGEFIRVVSDARKTTVSLDASGPHGGAMLLESERRTAADGRIIVE